MSGKKKGQSDEDCPFWFAEKPVSLWEVVAEGGPEHVVAALRLDAAYA